MGAVDEPEGGQRHGLPELMAERRAKLEQLRAASAGQQDQDTGERPDGSDPAAPAREENFPYAFPNVEPIAQVRAAYEHLAAGEETEDAHRVAGRITGKRGGGRAAFLDIVDRSGKIQLHARLDVLGEDGWRCCGCSTSAT